MIIQTFKNDVKTASQLKAGLIASPDNYVNEAVAKKMKFKIFGAGMVMDDDMPFLEVDCFKTKSDIFLGFITPGSEYSKQVKRFWCISIFNAPLVGTHRIRSFPVDRLSNPWI